MAEPSKPARIWYQSFVHPIEQAPYIERLQAYLDKGRLSPVLQSIAVRVILDDTCALLGAAAYAEARAAEISGRSERAASTHG